MNNNNNNNNNNNSEAFDNDNNGTIHDHAEMYTQTESNNVADMPVEDILEYLTDYASLTDGATWDEVHEALETLNSHFIGEYEDYRELAEDLIEQLGDIELPDWVVIDYTACWENNLRHDMIKLGDTFNRGSGYYYFQH